MMANMQLRSSAIVIFFALTFTIGKSEYISDMVVGDSDQTRALEVKAEQFWGSILAAAKGAKMSEHAQLYADTQKVISELPTEHAYVKEALVEALSHLKHADDLVLVQAVSSTELASEELGKPMSGSKESAFSFMTGGKWMSFFKQRLDSFANEGGDYSRRLVELVAERQADILPMLQGTAEITGNVLSDCRIAQKRSFDALKYDIYVRLRGAPRTPENAKEVANRLVDAAGETRHRFTRFVTETVSRIAKDTEGKHDGAAVTVTRASVDVELKDSGLSLGARISSSIIDV